MCNALLHRSHEGLCMAARLLIPCCLSPQSKMVSSEQKVAELTRSLELLMREKKELELKERIMRYSLEGLSLHLDHLFADKVTAGEA